MNLPDPTTLDFSEVLNELPTDQIWEYAAGGKKSLRDVAAATITALRAPLDYPPIDAAIAPGDRVALSVDPNVPQLPDVIRGIIDTLSKSDTEEIDIVLWEEASDELMTALQSQFSSQVSRHQSDDRAGLRYMAADHAGEAIYLNRVLVDADFVLPVIAHRVMDQICDHDLTGVYPSMSDSATRYRHRQQMSQPDANVEPRNEEQVPWLLGVSLMVSISTNHAGLAGEVIAGTPEAIGKRISPTRRRSHDFPPAADLVVASLDGNSQQQTWQNAARAAVAASRYTQTGGTIVLWTEISVPPTGKLQSVDEIDLAAAMAADPVDLTIDDQGALPPWHATDAVAFSLARVAEDFRVLIHSQLDENVIESMGLGCVQNAAELAQLCRSFDSCGILRGASFAGSTTDAPHRMGLET